MRPAGALLALLGTLANAQDLGKLPEWAQGPAREGLAAAAPDNADAWVLLDRTEFAYTGDGEIRQVHRRLVRVLTERGLGEGVYFLSGLGGRANKVKRIKGWNCRPDGEVVRLDQDDIVAVDADSAHTVTTGVRTGAGLDRVVKGSLVAFESQKTFRYVAGPGGSAWPLERNPVRLWEFVLGKAEGLFTNLKQVQMDLQSRNLKPWLGLDELHGVHSVALRDLPALPRDESAIPDPRDVLPRIVVRFQDPSLQDAAPMTSWDALATWYEARYRERSSALKPAAGVPADPLEGLRQAHAWVARQVTYRQVYLTPDRGWIPETAAEVQRKLYGDCKDLTSILVGFSRGLGLEAYPVLSRIVEGRVAEDEPVESGAFNHVIAAVQLTRSLDLPAEVQTPKGRFLLIDMTARFTPFGHLPDGHRNRRVMICLPGGAVWTRVPEQAVQRPGVAYALEGRVDASYRLKGLLKVEELGDYLGYRSATAEGGAKGLRDAVARRLDLPLDVVWDVQAKGDPLDLSQPFRFAIDLDHPKAIWMEGSDWVLTRIGLPGIPELIQKAGQPRRYPVEKGGFSHWRYENRLALPVPTLAPVVPVHEEEDVFRRWSWQSAVKEGTWTARFEQVRKDAWYGFEKREEGVKEARRDRSRFKLFLEEGLALKPKP